jgi:hypothetical protein
MDTGTTAGMTAGTEDKPIKALAKKLPAGGKFPAGRWETAAAES